MPIVGRLVDDSVVAESRRTLGRRVDRSRQQWNTEANADAIRQFAWGIGDDNPLWTDRDYAGSSVLGELTAPPTFVHSIDSGAVFPGLEGLARLFVGSEIEWFARIREGDRFTTEATYIDSIDLEGEKAGRMILQVGETRYWNQDGVLVARRIGKSMRVARRAAGGKLNYPPRLHHYTEEELRVIQETAIGEQRRGPEPRYWEQVAVGERIGPMVKGPLTLTDMICWYCGNGPHGRRPHRMFWREVEANPDFYYERADTGVLEFSERGHYDVKMARAVGMPGPYDNGSQRPCWMGHMITDWMGDAGFLAKLTTRLTLPNVFGDTTWLTGEVVGKSELSSSEGEVVINIEGHNQLDEQTTLGTAHVRLPRQPRS